MCWSAYASTSVPLSPVSSSVCCQTCAASWTRSPYAAARSLFGRMQTTSQARAPLPVSSWVLPSVPGESQSGSGLASKL